MWKKIKENKFLIGLILIFAIRMILISVQNGQFYYIAGNDDAFVLGSAERMLSMDWLGPYYSLTLSKGIFASIFIAASNVLGIPFLMAEHLFYAGAVLMFVMVTRKLIKNDGVSLILFAVLLFSPIFFTISLMRVYRDYVYASLLLYLISCMFGIFFNYKEKWTKLIFYMIGFGLSFTCMWICREETIWVVPFVLIGTIITVLFMALDKNCLEKRKKFILYLIPIFIFVIIIFVICLFNKIAYGLFTLNQYSGKVWNNLMEALTSVKTEERIDKVPVSREARKKIYEVSPAFKELEEFFEESEDGKGWANNGTIDGEIEEGWFSWAFLAAVQEAGYFDTDAKTANDYFKRITDEINEAYNDGRLEKSEEKKSFLELDRIDDLFANIKTTFDYQVKLSNMENEIRMPEDEFSAKLDTDVEQVDKFREITGNIAPNSLTYNYWVDGFKLNSLINITKVYQKLCPYLFYIAIITYIVNLVIFIKKKSRFENYKEMLLLTGILMLYILRIIVIAYTETFKFTGAISGMYLACTYSLQFAFEILSIYFMIKYFIKNKKEEQQK